ncbi:Vegetative incompatibility protein HET-E-1 [Durusdinium trenchii]|uniref:Vegetative incompatibility protein HET-E-1 n=1 Tax=Durusdinium trenchii TaxID=1381693 RepID=A0ABP0S4C9_9DINO
MPRGRQVHVCCAQTPRAEEEEQQREQQQHGAWGKQQAAFVVALRHALPDREVTCTGAGGGEVDVEQVGLAVVCASQRLVDAVNGRQALVWSEWSALVVRKQLPFVVVVVEPEASQEHWTGGFALQAGRAAAVVGLTGEEKGIVEDAVAQIVRHVEPEEEDDQQGSEDDVVIFALNGFDPLQVAREKSALYVEGTRAWALDEFRAWANRPASVWASDRVLVFVGPAGFGKSVLMARICDENGLLDDDDDDDDGADEASSPARKKRRSIPLLSMLGEKKTQEQTVVKVRAAHFFKDDDKQACDLKTSLLSMANQLAAVLPEYCKEIAKLDKNEILHGLGPAVLFDRLIAEPMSKVPEPSERVVVLLDALDEVTETDRGVLLHIVRNLWHTKTPEWLGLVLSTRPEDPIRDTLEVFRPTVLQLDDERNLADLRLFLEMRLRRHLAHVDRDLERAVEILAERAEGLFLYAYFVAQTLVGRESKLTSLEELEEVFPDGGVDDMYQSCFSRLLEGPLHGDQELYGVLLGTLVAARSPVPRDVLQAAVRVDDVREFDEILARSVQLLAVGPDTVRYIHKSMSDFVQDRRHAGSRLFVDSAIGHKELARVVVEDQDLMRSSSFLLRHALFHLSQTGDLDALADWLFEFRNLHGALRCGIDPTDLVWDVSKEVRASQEVEDVLRALELSSIALRNDLNELAGQILGRILDPEHPLRVSLQVHWRPERPFLRVMSLGCIENTRSSVRKILRGDAGLGACVAMSPDTNSVVGGDDDGMLHVFDIRTATVRLILRGHRSRVSCVAISQDNTMVVSGSRDLTVRLWCFETGAERSTLRGHTREVCCVAVSPDTRIVASGSNDTTVHVWDVQTGVARHVLQTQELLVSVGFSLDSKTLLSGDADGCVRIWNVATSEQVRVLVDPFDSGNEFVDGEFVAITSFAFSTDVVAKSYAHGMVRVVDAHSGGVMWTRGGGGDFGFITAVAIAQDGKIMASSSDDGTIRIWEVSSGTELKVLGGHSAVHGVAISTDGGTVATASSDASVRLWDLRYDEQGRVLRQCRALVRSGVLISRDGKLAVSWTREWRKKKLRLWDAKTGSEKFCLEAESLEPELSMDVSENGTLVATFDNLVRVWDAETGAQIRVFRKHSAPVLQVAISGDGMTVVSASEDSTVRIWDAITGRSRCVLLHSSSRELPGLAISDQGTAVVGISSDGSVWLWCANAGSHSHLLEGIDEARSVAISRDGTTAVCGLTDGTVHLWDAVKDVRKCVLRGHRCSVCHVAISNDSVKVSSKSKLDGVIFWDATSGKHIDEDFCSDMGGAIPFGTPPDVAAVANQPEYHLRLRRGVGLALDVKIAHGTRVGTTVACMHKYRDDAFFFEVVLPRSQG